MLLDCGNVEQAKELFFAEHGEKDNDTVVIESGEEVSFHDPTPAPIVNEQDRKPKDVLVRVDSSASDNAENKLLNSLLRQDQTQKEILKQLKQINWAIRIGFLFIMLVISGIIKPGAFSW